MRSLRKKLRRVVLAVPLATCACLAPPAATSPSSSATSGTSSAATSTGGGSTTIGHSLCESCAAQGLVCNPWDTGCIDPLDPITATGTSGGSGTTASATTGGTSGDSCPTLPPCPIDCRCEGSTFAVGPLDDAGAAPNICQCFQACPAQPDGGSDLITGSVHLAGCSAAPGDGGATLELTCYYASTCSAGRRPAGLAEGGCGESRSAIGSCFARMAHLEAASVVAFRRLARELRGLGAPRALIARAKQAAREEIRHTRALRGIARRFGAEPLPVCVGPMRPRSLEALAEENAREGCAGETLGAALAAWQALHATDVELRAAAASIAEDEAGHAELAWELDAWLQPQLTGEARVRVHAAREEAIQALESGAPVGTVPRELGLPSRAEYLGLVAGLRAEIWASA